MTGLIAAALLAVLTLIAYHGTLDRVDEALADAVVSGRSDGATTFFILLTDRFNTPATVIWCVVLSLVVLLCVWRSRQWWLVAVIPVSVAVTQAVTHTIKPLLALPRPPEAERLSHEVSYSFPSGHTASVASLVLSGLVVLAHLGVSRMIRVLSALVGAVLIVLVGYSRMYLGMHWFEDVIGGFLAAVLGVSVTVSFITWAGAKVTPPISPRKPDVEMP